MASEVQADTCRRSEGSAAIVIVSYEHLDYLRLCLDSLWQHTDATPFDAIVVDNGSQPEVVDYLQAVQAREPRLKVILNGQNLGFPRACNIGIRAAEQPDYLVFLNNDVVLTPGWLSGLIRHLNDPAIGLVGPVTNWAGNEARIRIGYKNLNGLSSFAERYTRAHAGRRFDINVLALYCAATRTAVLEQVGLLDERFDVGMFEDDDLSMRIRQAGYRVVCAEDVFVHHWGRASFGQLDRAAYDQLFAANRKKFEDKWGNRWQPHRSRWDWANTIDSIAARGWRLCRWRRRSPSKRRAETCSRLWPW
jgi:GT2 family glycosyltransferase